MKTKEELEQIKEEYQNLKKKLAELTEEELFQVSGGVNEYSDLFNIDNPEQQYNNNIYKDKETDTFKPKFID